MKRCNANRRRRGSIGRRRGINIFIIIVDIIIIIAETGSLPLSYCIEQFLNVFFLAGADAAVVPADAAAAGADAAVEPADAATAVMPSPIADLLILLPRRHDGLRWILCGVGSSRHKKQLSEPSLCRIDMQCWREIGDIAG